jgi:hypothetical protein
MNPGNRRCDRSTASAADASPPLVGAARRGKRPRELRVAVAIRRQTAEERRQYQNAVRALVAELVSRHLDREEE